MPTLKIDRDTDFAKRLGDLLQTRGEFTVIMLPDELVNSDFAKPLTRNTEMEIICGESQGRAVVENLRIKAIKDITLDELRFCIGPQNEKALLGVLNKGKPERFYLDRNSVVILLHLTAKPA